MKKMYLLVLLAAFGQTCFCQEKMDTAALIKEFKKVMSYTLEPYVFVATSNTIHSEPVVDMQDTLQTHGVFYKNETDLYYKNGNEEMYLQDSLLVQVNNERKTIWVSRVDKASKEKLGAQHADNKQLQELMRKNYTIRKTNIDNDRTAISFESKEITGRSAVISTHAELLFTQKDHHPLQLAVEMRMQQPASDEMVEQIKSQGVDERKLIQFIGGQRYLVRMQRVTVAFDHIDNTKEKAMQMPVWQAIVDVDPAEQKFIGKGNYSDYEVTKTF